MTWLLILVALQSGTPAIEKLGSYSSAESCWEAARGANVRPIGREPAGYGALWYCVAQEAR